MECPHAWISQNSGQISPDLNSSHNFLTPFRGPLRLQEAFFFPGNISFIIYSGPYNSFQKRRGGKKVRGRFLQPLPEKPVCRGWHFPLPAGSLRFPSEYPPQKCSPVRISPGIPHTLLRLCPGAGLRRVFLTLAPGLFPRRKSGP